MLAMMHAVGTLMQTSTTWLAVGLVWACCAVGCGGPTPTAARRTAASRPTIERTAVAPWILAEGPHHSVFYVAEEEAPGGGRCFTSGTARGCYREGAIHDVVLGSGSHWFEPEGRYEETWLFSTERGDLHVADGFTGSLRRVDAPPRTLPVRTRSGRFARLTVDGRLLRWDGERLEEQALPGRVYAADFFGGEGGLALVEPGVVYAMSDGATWRVISEPTPPPRTVSDVDDSVLPHDVASLRIRAPAERSRIGPDERSALQRAWLVWLLDRFAGASRPTVPTLLPELQRDLREHGLADVGELAGSSNLAALSDGWVVSSLDETIVLGADLGIAARYANFSNFGVVSRDGRYSVRSGSVCPGDADKDARLRDHFSRACFASPEGERTLTLPSGVGCASLVALSGDQLIVGGESCPTELCGTHALVRIDLTQRSDEALTAVPIPLDAAIEVPARPPVRSCRTLSRIEASQEIPEADVVRARIETADGHRLLVGSPTGPLRALPGPAARGSVAFADRDHGVWVSDARTWVTEDGGETWRELATEETSSESDVPSLSPPVCSRSACRVGGRFWLAPDTAAQLGLAREESLEEPTDAPYFGGMWMDAEREPWRTTAPTLPRLIPGDVFVDIAPPPDRAPLRGGVSQTISGVVARTPNHVSGPVSLAWRGLRADGTPFTVRVSPRSSEGPVGNASLGRPVALTPSFAVLLHWPREANSANASSTVSPALRVVTHGGLTHSVATPFEPGYAYGAFEPQAVWSLPLPTGGLGLVVIRAGQRWLVELDSDGVVVHQRMIAGLPIRRDEFLEWQQGELGLTAYGEEDATFQRVVGGQRTVTRPRTPSGPCLNAPNPRARWVGSSWRGPGRGSGGVGTPPGSWVVAEEEDGHSCVRQITAMWRRDRGSLTDNGVAIARSIGGELRATYVAAEGVVPWRVDASRCAECETDGVPRRESPRPTGEVSIARTTSGLELLLLPTRRTPEGEPRWPPFGRYAYDWDGDRLAARWLVAPANWRVFRDLEVAADRSLRGRRHRVSFPDAMSATVVPMDRSAAPVLADVQTPTGTLRVVADSGEGSRSLVYEPRTGDPVRTMLASPAEARIHYVVRFSPDGSVVAEHFVRAPTGRELGPMAVVRVRAVDAAGRLRPATTHSAPMAEFGPFATMEVVPSGREVLVALTGSDGAPHRILRGRLGSRLRDAGAPIPSGTCGGRVLALSASPPAVAWTDCPLGNGSPHLRTAELRGREWTQQLRPLPVGESQAGVAAYAHPVRGFFVFFFDGDAVTLTQGTSDGWRTVGRLTPDDVRNVPMLNVQMPGRPSGGGR